MSSLLGKIKSFVDFTSTKPDDDDTFRWKYIDLDNDIVEEIKSIYLNNLPNNPHQFQILDLKVPDILGKSVHHSRLIYSPPNFNPTYGHKDPRNGSAFVVNIPLINCEDSVTTLYKSNKKSKKMYYGTELIEILTINDTEPVDSYTLSRPIMFNTRIFHAVRNFSNKPRLAISLQFKTDPVEWI
jgi:hypothetical protein